ncbi:hypothetical protein BDZ91DRAFT_828913, partial [Kalaharituber pfeilii]
KAQYSLKFQTHNYITSTVSKPTTIRVIEHLNTCIHRQHFIMAPKGSSGGGKGGSRSGGGGGNALNIQLSKEQTAALVLGILFGPPSLYILYKFIKNLRFKIKEWRKARLVAKGTPRDLEAQREGVEMPANIQTGAEPLNMYHCGTPTAPNTVQGNYEVLPSIY